MPSALLVAFVPMAAAIGCAQLSGWDDLSIAPVDAMVLETAPFEPPEVSTDGAPIDVDATDPVDVDATDSIDADVTLPVDADAANAPEVADTSDASDAPSGEGGVVPSPCSAPHLHCDDFDFGPLGNGWSQFDQGSSVTGSHDTVLHRSVPRSYMVHANGTAGGAFMLVEPFTAPNSDTVLRMEVDVHIEALPTGTTWVTLATFKRRMTTGEGVNVQLDANGMRIQVAGAQTYVPDVPVGRWFHLRVDVRIHRTVGSYTISIDGTQRLARTGLATASTDGLEREFLLGATSSTPVTARIRYDNVVLDWL
jgi:hypothetical protein